MKLHLVILLLAAFAAAAGGKLRHRIARKFSPRALLKSKSKKKLTRDDLTRDAELTPDAESTRDAAEFTPDAAETPDAEFEKIGKLLDPKAKKGGRHGWGGKLLRSKLLRSPFRRRKREETALQS